MAVSAPTGAWAGEQLSLLALQSRMKCDPAGYDEELLMQLRHFEACLSIFSLNSSLKTVSSSSDPGSSKELADLAMFLAHVTPFYPKHLGHFPRQLLHLLSTKAASLPSPLRRQLTQALILLSNRRMIELVQILPVMMELQTLGDRTLRKLAFLHIVHDVRRINLKHRNEAKNRALQNLIFPLLQEDNETRARRALLVLCNLHRRKVWVDERTSNAICMACFHTSSKILKATLLFLLGYERVDEDEEESSTDEDEECNPSVLLSREAVYKAHNKGTASSRKRKQAKLQRVRRSLKKQQRVQGTDSNNFSPLQHLHDPQAFAEKLFSRLQSPSCNERFEVRLLMIKVISRTVGLHRLMLISFYPFLQKYIQPHQRDVTQLLAAAVQACHDLVPPDAVESLLKQIVNQFIHDRARPEVIALGLNVVRELCMRMPLIMTRDLLQDLALYKKSREKAVSSAARSIIALFRQVFPSLLEKRDRGRFAELAIRPKAFGEKVVPDNVPGAELLKEAASSGSMDSDKDSDDFACMESDHSEAEDSREKVSIGEEQDGTSGSDAEDSDTEEYDSESEDDPAGTDKEVDQVNEDQDPVLSHEEGDALECRIIEENSVDSEDGATEEYGSESEEDKPIKDELYMTRKGAQQVNGNENVRAPLGNEVNKNINFSQQSLRGLKKQAAAIKAEQLHSSCNSLNNQTLDDGFFSNEDFMRIRQLQAIQAAKAAFAQHGMSKVKKNQKEEYRKIPDPEHLSRKGVNPTSLEPKIRKRQDREDRIASARAGRDDRPAYTARAAVKQKKTGGLSNRQKEKRKGMPLAAKRAKIARTQSCKKSKSSRKQFRGKKAWK